MKPQSIGRALGIGLRVVGRAAGQRIASASAPSAGDPSAAQAAAARSRATGQVAGQTTRNLGKGVRGFVRPFTRVGGILWLEVTGVFFLLPVVVFGPTAWRTRFSWAHGPDHRTFLVTMVIVVIFLYLSVTSFLRARSR
ncbi:MAG: hypothetical protein ABSF17_09780 [Terracidiphilus sp.]|jgi:hypothetical protein